MFEATIAVILHASPALAGGLLGVWIPGDGVLARVETCYVDALERDPSTSGVVLLQGEDVMSSTGDQALTECVGQAVLGPGEALPATVVIELATAAVPRRALERTIAHCASADELAHVVVRGVVTGGRLGGIDVTGGPDETRACVQARAEAWRLPVDGPLGVVVWLGPLPTLPVVVSASPAGPG